MNKIYFKSTNDDSSLLYEAIHPNDSKIKK